MNSEESKKKYGKSMWKKMCDSGWLSGITIEMRDDGTGDIPQGDLDRAYRAANGEKIHPLEWD